MIQRLLVANRAEIARRIFATCRRLGIETVAVHSDADATLPFVREADRAVLLPGNVPDETYLRGDLIIAAAARAGADAIHPGYGFLSENADFAQAVLDAGLLWVGPSPASIEAMGSKAAAKKLMEPAGIPVLASLVVETVAESDLPLLVKASAGGGGRGMRIVRTLAELPDEIEQAQAEAASAFGDATVFMEPYVEQGRHVEVQVVGHTQGVLVLGERDCSIQRRHQKLVEETPAPGLSDATRAALHEAARAAAAAIDYRGAGTVEFLVDATDPTRFWFLEMNTRLQVEHPVTELVHGVDLVEMQIAVAEGRPLEARAVGGTDGHAIEVRVYAEDPAAGWRPQSGLLSRFEVPGVSAAFGLLDRPGIRLDSGFVSGSEISTHYDAMLAKLISWAPRRDQAARQLASALARARIHGLVTNRDLLVEVLRHPRFLAGNHSTSFLTEEKLVACHPRSGPGDQAAACFAAAMALVSREASRRPVQQGIPSGWRNVHSAPQVVIFDLSGTRLEVGWRHGRAGLELVDVDNEGHGARLVHVEETEAGWRIVIDHDGLSTTHRVSIEGLHVDVDSPGGHVALTHVPRFTDPAGTVASGSLLAPMPGIVLRVEVEAGRQVVAGQPVLVLEAMKMRHTVSAPHAGTVTEVLVVSGQQVTVGDVLAVVREEDA